MRGACKKMIVMQHYINNTIHRLDMDHTDRKVHKRMVLVKVHDIIQNNE